MSISGGSVSITTTAYTKTSIIGMTSDNSLVVPAGNQIISIVIRETAGHAITGGLKIGTTSGAVDVAGNGAAIAVSANTLLSSFSAALNPGGLGFSLERYVFSATTDTTIYFKAVTSWNSASLNVTLQLCQFD